MAVGDRIKTLVNGVDITVANYGCTLSAPATVRMDNSTADRHHPPDGGPLC
ncbi:hypothetical protein [Enterobacter cloacae]|uniref:hypothetical protein n=1 Tax=Enterobacter cloacae TaxID=550 RepID=UPI002B219B80|nr:hypothetical protein [Enterobacter cloacae]MEA5217574.1 hypothetical protein [Enterobacter cloacae]